MSDLVSLDSRPAGTGRVVTLTLQNERRLNCLGTPLMQTAIAEMEKLAFDDSVRALIVTGAGDRSFMGGADLNELGELNPTSARAFISGVHHFCRAFYEFPVPVIARINGFCLGAGLEAAAACDLRVASDNAVFGMPEVKLGMPSVVEAAFLPRLVGCGRARQFVYTAENIDATTALDWGMVEDVVPLDQLDEAVDRMVTPIAESGPKAMRLQKTLVRQWETMSASDAIRHSIDAFARHAGEDEPKQMIAALRQQLKDRKTAK